MANMLKSSLISVGALFVSLVAGFGSNIVASRLLGPAGAGTVAFSLWVAMSASAVADQGLPQSMLRNIGSYIGAGRDWRELVNAACRRFVPAVLTVALAILAYAVFAGQRDIAAGWVWTVTAALFVSYALAAFALAVARGRDRFGPAAVYSVMGAGLQLPLVAIGALLWGPAGALIGHVGRYLPQAMRFNPYPRHPSRRLPPEVSTYSRNMWVSDLVEVMILARIEFLFLGIFYSTTAIGYFAAGLALAGLLEQMALQIAPALVVGFVEGHGADDRATLKRSYDQSMRMVALIALPVSLGGAAIMPALLPVVFGPLFVPAIPAAVLLMAFVWTAALAIVPWGMIGAAGASDHILRVQIGTGLLTILLLLAVVPWGGIEGAAWVRGGVSLLTLIVLIAIARRKVGVSLPWAELGKAMLAGILCAIGASGPVTLLSGVPAIILGILAGAVTYVLAIRIMGLVNRQDAELLQDSMPDRLPASVRPALHGLIDLLAPR